MGAGAATMAGSVFPISAIAQGIADYPNRPITLIVPWAAGSGIDILHRTLAEAASKHLGQPMVVDNRSGAGGTAGPATMAALAKPDGYTISHVPIGVFLLPLQQKVPWNPLTDFTFIIHLSGFPTGLVVKSESPFKSFRDLISFARANPGSLTYGSPGAAGSLHIGMEVIARQEGVQLTHVPFNAGIEIAVVGGHIMAAASGLPVMKPLIEAGQLRALTVFTAERRPWLSDVPTMRDLGYDFVLDAPFGIAGPRGMEAGIVEKLHDAFNLARKDPKVLDVMNRLDYPDRYMDPQAYTIFARHLFNEQKRYLETIGLAKNN